MMFVPAEEVPLELQIAAALAAYEATEAPLRSAPGVLPPTESMWDSVLNFESG